MATLSDYGYNIASVRQQLLSQLICKDLNTVVSGDPTQDYCGHGVLGPVCPFPPHCITAICAKHRWRETIASMRHKV